MFIFQELKSVMRVSCNKDFHILNNKKNVCNLLQPPNCPCMVSSSQCSSFHNYFLCGDVNIDTHTDRQTDTHTHTHTHTHTRGDYFLKMILCNCMYPILFSG